MWVRYCNFTSAAFLGLLGFFNKAAIEIKCIATLLSAAKYSTREYNAYEGLLVSGGTSEKQAPYRLSWVSAHIAPSRGHA